MSLSLNSSSDTVPAFADKEPHLDQRSDAGKKLDSQHLLSRKLLLAIIVFWVLLLLPRVAWGPRFYMDSSQYVECARNIVEGNGFLHRPQRGIENAELVPMTLWPPGYPLLVAATMMLGLTAPIAALVVPIVSSFVCVILIAHLYLRWLPPAVATPTLLATVLMPVFAYASGMALSESPCLAASLASIAALFLWADNGRHPFVWLFFAGLAGGVAWCIRNSSVGLFAASFLFIAGHVLWAPFWHAVKSLFIWCAGWCVASAWLVMRNLVAFGKFNPYYMPPSDLSLWANLRQTWHVLVADLTGSTAIAGWFNDKSVIAVLGLLVLGTGLYALIQMSKQSGMALFYRYRMHFFLALYVMLTIATTAIARSVYKWGEWINSRHFYPIYWIVWLSVALAAWQVARRLLADRKTAAIASCAIMSVVVLIQAVAYTRSLTDYRNMTVRFHNLHTTWQDEGVVRRVSEFIDDDKLVLTDSADYLRILGDVHARRFVRPGSDSEPEITLDDVQQSAADGLFWGFVIWERELSASGRFGSMVQDLVTADKLPGFVERIELDGSFPLLLRVHPVEHTDDE